MPFAKNYSLRFSETKCWCPTIDSEAFFTEVGTGTCCRQWFPIFWKYWRELFEEVKQQNLLFQTYAVKNMTPHWCVNITICTVLCIGYQKCRRHMSDRSFLMMNEGWWCFVSEEGTGDGSISYTSAPLVMFSDVCGTQTLQVAVWVWLYYYFFFFFIQKTVWWFVIKNMNIEANWIELVYVKLDKIKWIKRN